MQTQPCIVVAERDSARRQSISVALCRQGYEVREAEDGRQLLGYIEYLAATRGKRGKPFRIAADSFAVVAGPDLGEVTAEEVREILRRARWDVPVILLPMANGGDVAVLQAYLREILPLEPPC